MHSFQRAIFQSIAPSSLQKRTARYRKLLLGVPPTFLLGLEDPVKLFCGRRIDAEYDTLVIFPRMAGEYAFLQLEHEEAELDVPDGSTAASILDMCKLTGSYRKYIVPIINGERSSYDRVLKDADRMFMYLLVG